jgi:prepilin-type N-terminal cleavage/methylation domain-containing protein
MIRLSTGRRCFVNKRSPIQQARIGSCGITLIEVLIVVAIIGILIQIGLPAIMSAREASRRAKCANSLRQIGLVVQNYHNAKKGFPPNRLQCFHGTWATELWPYLEEKALTNLWDPQKAFWYHPVEAREAQMSILYCPSRRKPPKLSRSGQEDRKIGPAGVVGGLSDYAACMGDGSVPNDYFEARANGIFVTSNAKLPEAHPHRCAGEFPNLLFHGEQLYVRMKDVTDGASKTLPVGEKYLPTDGFGYFYDGRTLYGDSSVYNPDHRESLGRFAGPTNSFVDDSAPPRRRVVPFGGSHVGVGQFAYSDGSVHSVSMDINGEILGYLANRSDGQLFDASP